MIQGEEQHLVDDAKGVQVFHVRQGETEHNMKSISLALLSVGENQLNVPKHGYEKWLCWLRYPKISGSRGS